MENRPNNMLAALPFGFVHPAYWKSLIRHLATSWLKKQQQNY